MTKSYVFSEIKDYVFILVGAILYGMGLTVFMLPYELASGGVAGIASIIYYATGLEIQNTYVTINILLLIAAIRVLGIRFCIKTIYGVAAVSLSMWAWQRLIEVPDPANADVMMLPQYIGNETFMACILGSICCGLGLALCFESNGSTGGTDIIAAIVNKYKSMSLGSVIMACDAFIISSCYFVFHDWARVIYGFVIMFVCSVTLDYCIRRQHQSVQFMIFSRNYQRIADAINDMHHGATILDGEGWYTKSERKVIVSIVRKHEAKAILANIKRIDPYAFVSMSETHSVFGEAFDVMKISTGKGVKHNHVVVYTTDDQQLAAQVQEWLGDEFEVRTYSDIGCDTSQKINAVLLDGTPEVKALHVKRYYGFDCITEESDGLFTLALGDYVTRNHEIREHIKREELVENLKPVDKSKRAKK